MVNIKINGYAIDDIGLIIFDRDGTLIDLYAYWSWMVGKRAELICRKLNLGEEYRKKLIFVMGINEQNKRIRPEGPVGLKKREIVMQSAIDYLSSIGLSYTFEICLQSFQETDKLSFANLSSIIKPINGLYELFNQLVKNSCKIAIATTDKTERAKIIIDFLGLTNQIDFIVGENSVEKPKPAPDMVNLILESLKIERSRALIVGDAVTDIQMGINAKVKASIAVLNGLTPKSELKKLTPYLIESIEEIEVANAR